MFRRILPAILLASLFGCGAREPVAPSPAAIAPAPPPIPNPIIPVESPRNPIIPVEGPYLITEDVDQGPLRRLVEVMLKKKVTPEALREIALEVKAKERIIHKRTTIYYYLPVEFPEIAGVPWASSHFNPTLEVKILGLSHEEEVAMRSLPLDHKGTRIGAWLQDNQFKTIDLIYDEAGTIKIAEIRSPTERSDSIMIELPSPTGRRFRKARGSNIYDVDPEGNLRISNEEGKVFSAARPMR